MPQAAAANPNYITIFLFVISFLLTVVIGLVGFIGVGMSKKLDRTEKATALRFETVFKEFKGYRTEKVCQILMSVEEKAREKVEGDLNNLGKKVDGLETDG